MLNDAEMKRHIQSVLNGLEGLLPDDATDVLVNTLGVVICSHSETAATAEASATLAATAIECAVGVNYEAHAAATRGKGRKFDA